MQYDVNTIDGLIEALGGPAQLGDALGIGAAAVCNWKARGWIPPSWHLRLLIELRALSLSVDPALLECSPEQFQVLFPTRAMSEAVA